MDGQPRDLHFDDALANLYCDPPEEQIVQPRSHMADMLATVTRLVSCERFTISRLRFAEAFSRELPDRELTAWIVLNGRGGLVRQQHRCDFKPGDVVVIPAESSKIRVETATDCELLEVKAPA